MQTETNLSEIQRGESGGIQPAASAEGSAVSKAAKSIERLRFVCWLALPHWARVPASQIQLARDLRVHETTLSRWKSEGALDEAMAMAEATLRERHGEIMQALGDKASAGDVAAIRTYLEYILRRAAPARVEVNTSGPTQINFG